MSPSLGIILTIVALLPVIALLIYIYKMDKLEKEPIGLLIGLFFMGVLSCIPVIFVELGLGSVIDTAFYGGNSFLKDIVDNFIGIALVEESFKWLFVFLITFRNKNFDCLYDGIVYTAFVSLGFAALENIFYVIENGWGTALLRMITAVPAHCFFGIIMGYYYGWWRVNQKAARLEKNLQAVNLVPAGKPSFSSGWLLVLSLALPTLAHGFYDFCATRGGWIYLALFFSFLILLYVLCFRIVHKQSKADNFSNFISMDMVLKKYPQATGYVQQLPEYAPFFGVPMQQQQFGFTRQPYMQPVQPINVQPFGQPAQPVNPQPYARPVQPAQPVNPQPYARPVQPAQPVDPQLYARPVQPAQPMDPQPYARPVQPAQPISGQQEPPQNGSQQ